MSDPVDCQEFHELCMDYRGASVSLAQGAYERLQEYLRSKLDLFALDAEVLEALRFCRSLLEDYEKFGVIETPHLLVGLDLMRSAIAKVGGQ